MELALPHHGPYRILDLTSTGATVRPVDQPDQKPILVNLDRVSKCLSDLHDAYWLSPRSRHRRGKPSSYCEQKTTGKHRLDDDVQVEARVTRGREKKRRGVM